MTAPAQLAPVALLRLVHDPASAGIVIAGVMVGDDGVHIVRRDGTVEQVLAGGHPRPGLAHATTWRRAPGLAVDPCVRRGG